MSCLSGASCPSSLPSRRPRLWRLSRRLGPPRPAPGRGCVKLSFGVAPAVPWALPPSTTSPAQGPRNHVPLSLSLTSPPRPCGSPASWTQTPLLLLCLSGGGVLRTIRKCWRFQICLLTKNTFPLVLHQVVEKWALPQNLFNPCGTFPCGGRSKSHDQEQAAAAWWV